MNRLDKYYFSFNNDEDFVCVVITPKELWDSEGCYDDTSEADEDVEPYGFCRLQESVYELPDEMSPRQARDILLNTGATLNDELNTNFGSSAYVFED